MTWPDGRRGAPRPDDPSSSGRRRTGPERRGLIALFLGVAGVVLSVLFVPVGLVLDVAAIVVGLRAVRGSGPERGWESGEPTGGGKGRAPGAVPGVVLGSVGVVLAAIVLTVLGFFWQEVRAYQECMSGANTITVKERCRAAFERSIERRLGLTSAPQSRTQRGG